LALIIQTEFLKEKTLLIVNALSYLWGIIQHAGSF